MLVPGIDVSNWQGEIDWEQVAASGQQFAICKASEGVDYRDATFARNWGELKRVGLSRGAYHFARPVGRNPEQQAALFLLALRDAGGLEPGDVVALDLESGDDGNNLLDWTLRWLRAVEAAVGCKPLLYSGIWFMEPHGLTGNAELGEYGLWLADWGTEMPEPPAGWPFVAVWQFSSAGQVPGIVGRCDLDQFNGETVEQFRRYGVLSAWPWPPAAPATTDTSSTTEVPTMQPATPAPEPASAPSEAPATEGPSSPVEAAPGAPTPAESPRWQQRGDLILDTQTGTGYSVRTAPDEALAALGLSRPASPAASPAAVVLLPRIEALKRELAALEELVRAL